jgi:transposase
MSTTRKSYPSDVSDAEWAFLIPYLTLMRADAPQREDALRDVFAAARYVVKTGCQWDFLPHDFPPASAVYPPARRWVAAGVFEMITHDLRLILRIVDGREGQPTAAILDGRTRQSTPESGGRAGYDGAKEKKGSKVHVAVDTLGNLLALRVTAANEPERGQVAELTAQLRTVTGGTVEMAFVDQGYTGEAAAEEAKANGIRLEVVKHTEAKRGFGLLPRRWGGRTQSRMARPVPEAGPRLRTIARGSRRLALARVPHPVASQTRVGKCIIGSRVNSGHVFIWTV